jgi:hypothetical protein
MATTTSQATETMSKVLTNTESALNTGMSVFNKNNYVKNLVLVLLILYAPLAAPMVGKSIATILNNYAVKLIYVFVLTYLLSNSVRVSILTSIVIVLGIYLLKKFNYENMEAIHIPVEGKKIIKQLDNTTLPLEPVVDRLEVTKANVLNNMCGDAKLEDNSLDNFREHHALADHSDSLQPRLIQNPFQPMDLSEIKGYDESDSTQSEFQ